MLNLYNEAVKLRQQIELVKTENLPLFSSSFPINACKHSSLLFCYHLGLKGVDYPLSVIFGISSTRHDEIGHWWIEVGDLIIDLTADQFNLIDDDELSYKIRANRDYSKVYCCSKNEAPHYRVFLPVAKESFIWDLSEIADDYIDDLEVFYQSIDMIKIT
ncbi:MAG: hypothetical protein ACSHW0_17115 [Thalassotalea sp.]